MTLPIWSAMPFVTDSLNLRHRRPIDVILSANRNFSEVYSFGPPLEGRRREKDISLRLFVSFQQWKREKRSVKLFHGSLQNSIAHAHK